MDSLSLHYILTSIFVENKNLSLGLGQAGS